MPLFRCFALMVLSVSLAAAQTPPTPPGATPPPATPPATPTTPAPVAPPVIPVTPAKPTPAKPAPGGVIPGAMPAVPAGAPGALVPSRKPARDPNVPLGDTKIVEAIEQASLKGSELAVLYRKYTGRRVIVSAAAAAAEFAFIQDASPEDPLTYAQAAELLKKAAAIENFVFIPDEKDPNLDILTVSTRPPGVGYDVLNENDPLPEGDAVISYVMTFKHLKPETAAQAFTQIIGQFGTYGSIAPLNGSVVVTENTSLIRRLIKLKEEIDKPSDITGTRFVAVKYADVTELAQTLNDLLNTQQQAQKTAAVQRSAVPAAPAVPGAPPQQTAAVVTAGAATSTDTPVQIIPEPRTNRIFAMGRPVDLLFVEGLIREFDIETSEKTFLRRKLSFLTVSDFLPIAADALNRAFTSTGEGGTAGAAGGTSGGSSRNTRTSSGTAGTSSGGRSSSTGRNSSTTMGNSSFGGGGNSSFGGGSSLGGGSGGGTSLGSPIASTAPESRLVGRTLLVADNITNSVVVQGPPSGLEVVERLLDQLDVKADQVMISTVIGQLTLTDDKEFGVGYLFNGSDVRGGAGGGVPAFTPGTATATAVASTFPELSLSDIALSGLRLYGKTGDLNIFLKALQERGDFTVLARPSIFTANNQKGVISSGERVAIPTGTNAYGAGVSGNVSTQIQYQDVVLKLEVIPLINSENEITLQISLLNDEVNGTQSIAGGAGAEPLVVPKITTREILTTVTIPNKETVVLGGLITVRKGDSVSGIPILSSIPYLGKLFSTTTKKDERAELLVFLQPSIIRSRNSLDSLQIDVDERYRVSGRLRNFADGPGVLPPLEPARPVADKGGAKSSTRDAPPKATPVNPQPAPAKVKKSIRPARL